MINHDILDRMTNDDRKYNSYLFEVFFFNFFLKCRTCNFIYKASILSVNFHSKLFNSYMLKGI